MISTYSNYSKLAKVLERSLDKLKNVEKTLSKLLSCLEAVLCAPYFLAFPHELSPMLG